MRAVDPRMRGEDLLDKRRSGAWQAEYENRIRIAQADPYARGDVERFMARLTSNGLRPHLRYSGGSDVAAACGQLAAAG